MKELVEYVVKALVNYPDEVVLKDYEQDDTVHIELCLANVDIGNIVGMKLGILSPPFERS